MVRDFVDRVFDGAAGGLLLHLAKDRPALEGRARRTISRGSSRRWRNDGVTCRRSRISSRGACRSPARRRVGGALPGSFVSTRPRCVTPSGGAAGRRAWRCRSCSRGGSSAIAPPNARRAGATMSSARTVPAASISCTLSASPALAAARHSGSALVAAVLVAGAVVRLMWLVVGPHPPPAAPPHRRADWCTTRQRRDRPRSSRRRADIRYVPTCGSRSLSVCRAGGPASRLSAPTPPATSARRPCARAVARPAPRLAVGRDRGVHSRRVLVPPGIVWLISRVQASSEEVVDELTVLATNARRTYLEALLAFADEPRVYPATPFARRRHLFRRMLLISREAVMSSRRIVSSCVAMGVVVDRDRSLGWVRVSVESRSAVVPVDGSASRRSPATCVPVSRGRLEP